MHDTDHCEELNGTQLAALATLAADPGSLDVEPATKSKLRKLGLVGKLVTHEGGRQKTTSPLTDAGRERLRSRASD